MPTKRLLTSSALFLALILLLVGCAVQSPNQGNPDLPLLSQEQTDLPIPPLDLQTDPPKTDPPSTDAPSTDAPVTDAPVTDAPITDAPVTDAPVTDAPVTDAPEPEVPSNPTLRGDETILTLDDDGSCQWQAETHTGANINLIAVCSGTLEADGMFTVSVTLYLCHRSIQFRDRTGCYLRIADKVHEFGVSATEQTTNETTMTLLTSFEARVNASEVFELEAMMPFYGTYSGVEIDLLTISERFAVIR